VHAEETVFNGDLKCHLVAICSLAVLVIATDRDKRTDLALAGGQRGIYRGKLVFYCLHVDEARAWVALLHR